MAATRNDFRVLAAALASTRPLTLEGHHTRPHLEANEEQWAQDAITISIACRKLNPAFRSDIFMSAIWGPRNEEEVQDRIDQLSAQLT